MMRGAYYNEIDRYAAAWLRNLISAGQIAPGDVDERSIADVRADDLAGYDQCHFFAGIGGWSYALRLAGWPDDRPVWTGSCPCQPFSVAGKRGGTSDVRHLWPVWFRLIKECRPAVVFGEQVASRAGLGWFDAVQVDLEGAGYAVGAADLCAAGIGAPHIRQRLYFVADADTYGRGGERIGAASDEYAPQRDDVDGCGEVVVGDAAGLRCREQGHAGAADRPDEAIQRPSGEAVRDRGQGSFDPGKTRPTGVGQADSVRDGRGSGGPGSVGGAESGVQGEDGERKRIRADAGPGSGPAVPVADADVRFSEDGGVQLRGGHLQREEDPAACFWSPCDWIPCRDGKARPVEPGTFPLAHGTSADMGSDRPGEDSPFRVIRDPKTGRSLGQAPWRIGMLRGYGNAIVPEVAAEFVMAYTGTEIAAERRKEE